MTVAFALDHPFFLVLAVLVVIFGAGRLTRVLTYDSYPPSIAIRKWWIGTVTKGNGWSKLADCFWCASPWITAVCIGWFFLTPLQLWILWSWWLFWGWLGLAYIAAIVLARDEPPAE